MFSEVIDLASDTATQPTPAMKRAMIDAPLGDEQRGDDPTTRALETKVAGLLGKAAALFFPSATMANQIAVRALTEPGDELLAAGNAHVFTAEVGATAVHSGVQSRPIDTASGTFTGDDVRRLTRWGRGPLTPRPRLLCVENTTNMGGGIAWTAAQLADVAESARQLGLSLHLDGARLFNAVVKTGMTPAAIAAPFDTVTICLSKGLGCAAGAVLAFEASRYDRIRRLKQMMGGSLRQSGILAAAGLYALEHHVERLAEDHENAALLARGLASIPGVSVENSEPSTNMVFFTVRAKELSETEWLAHCIKKGVRFSQVDRNRFRAVTHLGVSRESIEAAIRRVRAVME